MTQRQSIRDRIISKKQELEKRLKDAPMSARNEIQNLIDALVARLQELSPGIYDRSHQNTAFQTNRDRIESIPSIK